MVPLQCAPAPEEQVAEQRDIVPGADRLLAMGAAGIGVHQVIGRPRCFGRKTQHFVGLGTPLPCKHLRQAPHQHIEKAADDQPQQSRQRHKQPGGFTQQLAQNALPNWKTGKYMAMTSAPTMPPSTTMISGSIRLVRLST